MQEVYLKISVEWVRGDVKGLIWNGIIRSPCPVSSLSKALLRVIRDRVPKQTIVFRTGDKPCFDDRCGLAHHAQQGACRVWSRRMTQADWEEYRVARRHGQLVYEDAERAFTERSKSFLTNTLNQRKWWYTVKSAVFGTSSSLPPLIDRGGKLVWSAVEMASLFSAHSDSKQRRDHFQQLHSFAPSPVLCSVTFRHGICL